jgi:predicted nucleic acid-binding protein
MLLLDTNVIVRHVTGEPPEQAARASRLLAEAPDLVLTDVVAAELVYVLQSVYRLQRDAVAAVLRVVLAAPNVRSERPSVLHRAADLYAGPRLDFAEAYLVAVAEATGAEGVASFDRGIDRVPNIRIEP